MNCLLEVHRLFKKSTNSTST